MKETNSKPSTYHSEWQHNRIEFILSLHSPDFFKGKKILELGSFNGYIGNYFAEVLESDVTSIEGRSENVSIIKNDYPLLQVECRDLDTPEWIFGKYDVIINFGLYYHLDCKFVKHCNSRLNGGAHHYDWEDRDSKVADGHARRFWVIENETDFTPG